MQPGNLLGSGLALQKWLLHSTPCLDLTVFCFGGSDFCLSKHRKAWSDVDVLETKSVRKCPRIWDPFCCRRCEANIRSAKLHQQRHGRHAPVFLPILFWHFLVPFLFQKGFVIFQDERVVCFFCKKNLQGSANALAQQHAMVLLAWEPFEDPAISWEKIHGQVRLGVVRVESVDTCRHVSFKGCWNSRNHWNHLEITVGFHKLSVQYWC